MIMRTVFRCVAVGWVVAMLVFGGSALAQTSPPPDVKKWVTEHDKNGDGKLDREEFHQAVVEAFFFRDKDKSGYLTITELKEASPETLKAVARKSDGRISLQEFVNALFKDFEAMDTDHDGLLTVEEIQIYIRTSK
jgi:Ca2+-binding EF-hand superfamily protein